ncbi:MAG TPA: hypothetical protein VLT33_01805 [Labilithrix sp.]|nr:hypothetical protein [Labilithrix sp.]
MKPNKLLHVLVALGAGLTGGLDAFGCGGTTDASSASDAAADGSGHYGGIAVDAGSGTIRPFPSDASPVDADAGDADLDADLDGGDGGDGEPG